MGELSESTKVQMHASQINNILSKGGRRFFNFREIAEKMKEAAWNEFDCLNPALEQLKAHGEIDYDPTYGYCRKGQKETLRRDMGKPKMTRADFDRLDYAAQAKHFKNGGIVV